MNPATKVAIGTVQNYIFDPITINIIDYTASDSAYVQWAATELLARLNTYPNDPPLITISNFMAQMELFACTKRSMHYIFTSAYEFGEFISDLLCK